MTEARDIRMGQWGFSNQVSHHIPFAYIDAGQPWKTQQITREVQSRHFVGSDIGQGYAGDEDNGETSAWWLFTMLGLYPQQLGDGTYTRDLAAVHEGDRPSPRRWGHRRQRPREQHREHLCPVPRGRRREPGAGLDRPRDARRRRRPTTSRWARSPPTGERIPRMPVRRPPRAMSPRSRSPISWPTRHRWEGSRARSRSSTTTRRPSSSSPRRTPSPISRTPRAMKSRCTR